MALFRRNKKDSVMPEEVRDFYASEHRDRKGMAWLLAVATLLVTFLIAAALFFGGRWIYRTVFDNNDTTTTQKEPADEAGSEEQIELGDKKTSQNSGSSSNTSGSSSTGTPGSNTGTSSTNTTQTPVTGPSELVNTGPGDEL